jgi:hypothetical protein
MDQQIAVATILHGSACRTPQPGYEWCDQCRVYVATAPIIENLRPPRRAGGTIQTATDPE